MAKRIVVIASGETERRALPRLLSHLEDEGVSIVDVLIPRRNRALDVRMAERLLKSAWYESTADRPDKFVVLLDTDGKAPDEVLAPFREGIPGRLGDDIEADILYAYAQWHLEAWYFGDAANLRGFLGGSLGSVDTSKPDEIPNPKLHLRNVLGDRVYTARVSEEIAERMNAATIAQRSPSFSGFLEVVANGSMAVDTSGTIRP